MKFNSKYNLNKFKGEVIDKKKLYKSKHSWIVNSTKLAIIAGVTVSSGIALSGNVKADTNAATNQTAASAQNGTASSAENQAKQASQANSSSSNEQVKPVATNDNGLNQAVDNAKNNGVKVNEQPEKVVTATPDTVNDKKAEIENSNSAQANNVNAVTNQYKNEKAAADATNAQKQAEYDQAKAKYDSDLKDYNDQKSYNDSIAKNASSESVNPNNVTQQFHLSKSPDAKLQIDAPQDKVTINDKDDKGYTNTSDWNTILHFDSTWASQTTKENPIATLTYTDINGSYTNSQGQEIKLAKRVDKYYGTENVKTMSFAKDPTLGNMYNADNEYAAKTKITHSISYFDEKGNQVNFDGPAYAEVMSLNNGSQDRQERVKVISGGYSKSIVGSSVTNHSDGLYSDIKNDDPLNWKWISDENKRQELHDDWMKSTNFGEREKYNWDTTNSVNSVFGAGLVVLQGNELVQEESTVNNGQNLFPVTWQTIPITWTITTSNLFGTKDLAKPTEPTKPNMITVAVPEVNVQRQKLQEVVPAPKETVVTPKPIDDKTKQPIKGVTVDPITVPGDHKTGDKVEIPTNHLPEIPGYNKPQGEKVAVTIGDNNKVNVSYAPKSVPSGSSSANTTKATAQNSTNTNSQTKSDKLPQTGETNNKLSIIGSVMIGLVGLLSVFGFNRKKRESK